MSTESSTNIANALAWLLCGFGLVQFGGYLTGSAALRGIGAASVVSPLPKVFSDVEGLETFASEFTLIFTDKDGVESSLPITAELYSKLAGPYKRRNVYGAAISYAPRLDASLWKPVMRYGVTGPLKEELGFPKEFQSVRLKIRTKTAGRNDEWLLEGL